MKTVALVDEAGPFQATVLEAGGAKRVALFSVGAGGNPERHLPLLAALAENGVTVVAPHFERLTSPRIAVDDLVLRARRLHLALDSIADPASTVVGVGHSIGATMLLALAGGQAWMGPNQRLPIVPDRRVRRLALLAPATGYFQAPGALDDMRAALLVCVGGRDTITPPSQAHFLSHQVRGHAEVEVRVEEDAGHFSFMHTLPPHVQDPLASREQFLARLTTDIITFATS